MRAARTSSLSPENALVVAIAAMTFSALPGCGARTALEGSEEDDPSAVVQVAAAAAQSCALRRNGEVLCWGAEGGVAAGPLPDAPLRERATRIDGVTNAVEIAVAAGHACARRQGGAVFCWGDNAVGQLGNGALASSGSAVRVDGLDDAIQISTMAAHTCAVRKSGKVVCWGVNEFGALGTLNALGQASVPVEVANLDDAIQVSAGEFSTCALRRSGKVVCWGRALDGQLGDGVPDHPACLGSAEPCVAEPVEVVGLDDAVEITAGLNGACARRGSGAVACWGWTYDPPNLPGEVSPTVPTAVEGLDDTVHVKAAYQRACALRASGELVCWGSNIHGVLGDGTTEDRSTPTLVRGVDGATQIVGGWYHTCVDTEDHRAACWGGNDWAQLGDGTHDDRIEPAPVLDL